MFFVQGSGSGTVILVGGNLKENNHAVKYSAIAIIFRLSYCRLHKTSSGNLYSQIWPRLVELAGDSGIGVLTAANSNAENSGNYYLEMFASWGARDPYWIPVQVGVDEFCLMKGNHSVYQEGDPAAAEDPEVVSR